MASSARRRRVGEALVTVGADWPRRAVALLQRFCGELVLVGVIGVVAALRPGAGIGVAMVAVAGGLIAARSPLFALYAIALTWAPLHLPLLHTQLAHRAGIDLSVSRVLGVALPAGLLLAMLRARRSVPRLPASFVAFAAFCVLYALQGARAPSHSTAVSDVARVGAGGVMLLAAFTFVTGRSELRRLGRFVAAAGLVAAIVTLAQFVAVHADQGFASRVFGSSFFERSYAPGFRSYSIRVHGLLGSANENSNFLFVSVAFALAVDSLNRPVRARNAFELMAAAVIGIAIVATATRTTTVGLLVLVIWWLVLSRDRFRLHPREMVRRRGVMLALAVSAAALAAIVSLTGVASRLSDVSPTSGRGFAQGRGAVWKKEASLLEHGSVAQLLVGRGVHRSYVVVRLNGVARNSPHDVPLWLLVETGLLGAALYFVFYGGTILRLVRARREVLLAQVAVGVLTAYVVIEVFILTVAAPAHRWYMMLFVGAVTRTCGEAPTGI
jgi:hypothetical protein